MLPVVLTTIVAVALTAPTGRAESNPDGKLSMPNVSIEGERQTPDIFFVFPTGKGGNLSAPRIRDYGPDVLSPLVKPWFERDAMVNPTTSRITSTDQIDLSALLKAEPPPRDDAVGAVPQSPPIASAPSREPGIPASARSLPPVPSAPSAPSTLSFPATREPSIPSAARSLPPAPSPPSSLSFPAPSMPSAPPSTAPSSADPSYDPNDGYVPPQS